MALGHGDLGLPEATVLTTSELGRGAGQRVGPLRNLKHEVPIQRDGGDEGPSVRIGGCDVAVERSTLRRDGQSPLRQELALDGSGRRRGGPTRAHEQPEGNWGAREKDPSPKTCSWCVGSALHWASSPWGSPCPPRDRRRRWAPPSQPRSISLITRGHTGGSPYWDPRSVALLWSPWLGRIAPAPHEGVARDPGAVQSDGHS